MNSYERQMNEMQQIRKRWSESEWRLGFLRSFTSQPQPQPTDDQLRQWDQQSKQICSPWQTAPTNLWT